MLSIGAFLGIAMSAGLLMLMRSIRPLAALKDAALRIGNNDLTCDIPHIKNHDEVGMLADAVYKMKINLEGSVREISDSATQVFASVATMSTIADHTSEGVAHQRRETDLVATSMNEMTSTVHEVARNTAAAAEAARNAEEEVSGGRAVVKKTIESIGRLAGEVRKGADVMSRLERDSENIGTVLDVIRGIAEQTNLLALNAAIEAARAGEQGRGFAVVADEVRTLAQRTQESTQEIQEMIEQLQSGAQEAVQVMDQGRTQAEASVDQAGKAGESLETIRNSVMTIHDMSTQIASAAEEQSAVAEEINRNIVSISEVVDQTSDGAAQTATASEELGMLAGSLQAIVSRFKIA
jgi:methyl-accepting chemotaxis protein